MGVEKVNYNEYYLICDVCGNEEKLKSFEECVEFKKENHWKSKYSNFDETWQDMCSSCKSLRKE